MENIHDYLEKLEELLAVYESLKNKLLQRQTILKIDEKTIQNITENILDMVMIALDGSKYNGKVFLTTH